MADNKTMQTWWDLGDLA